MWFGLANTRSLRVAFSPHINSCWCRPSTNCIRHFLEARPAAHRAVCGSCGVQRQHRVACRKWLARQCEVLSTYLHRATCHIAGTGRKDLVRRLPVLRYDIDAVPTTGMLLSCKLVFFGVTALKRGWHACPAVWLGVCWPRASKCVRTQRAPSAQRRRHPRYFWETNSSICIGCVPAVGRDRIWRGFVGWLSCPAAEDGVCMHASRLKGQEEWRHGRPSNWKSR
jgi:hypothetical protein